MIVGSRVPSWSMRLRTFSVASFILRSISCLIPASVGTSTICDELTTEKVQTLVCPSEPTISGSTRSRAASTLLASRTMKLTRPFEVEMSPISMRGLVARIVRNTWSLIVLSFVLTTSAVSASSSR
jgi:hypothetical protein